MFKRAWMQIVAAVAVLAGIWALVGCSSTHESAQRDTLTANVGVYPPGPSGVNKPRVGVPAFSVQSNGGLFGSGSDANALAADQMTTLLDQSGRFHVIERAQLQKLLDEQNLEGVVKPGELAKPGQVRGVDYLLLGKVTNLSVKRESTGNSFGAGQLGGLVNIGGAAVNNQKTAITTSCGVDIRLVDPTTGELMTSNFSEYNKTDSAQSMGLTILGASAQSNADVQLSEDDKGKILRLALDDALRKSLPKIDQFLVNQPAKNSAAAPNPPANNPPQNNPPQNTGASSAVNGSPTTTDSGNTAAAGKRFCPNCGTVNAADAKFCVKCGQKLD